MMRVAIVHEWLTRLAGSEKVVEAILPLYLDAPIHTLVHDAGATRGTAFEHRAIRESFISRLPFAKSRYRAYLPLMPIAIEQFDLSGYDVIVSSHHAVAKGVLTRGDQLHICYVHTPARYAWDLHSQYLAGKNAMSSALARWMLHRFRAWDVAAANRVDLFVANSRTVARRIWRTYRREARVIHPPVDVERFRADQPRDDFYLTVSRLVPYKKVELIVQAFGDLGLPLVVIGDGPDEPRIRQLARGNVKILGHQSDEAVADHMQRCRAFVMASDEDFGIAAVESQAAGAPVIAYGRGGATETVIEGETGLFFAEQSRAGIVQAVRTFEQSRHRFDPARISAHARQFNRRRFQEEFSQLVRDAWRDFQAPAGT